MAVVLRGEEGGDGVDLGVLDAGPQGSGPRRLRGDAGAAADDEADLGAQERRAGLPVDPPTSVVRAAGQRFPSRRRGVPAALVRVPGEAADRGTHALCAVQKALTEMNVRLDTVISDITGATGGGSCARSSTASATRADSRRFGAGG